MPRVVLGVAVAAALCAAAAIVFLRPMARSGGSAGEGAAPSHATAARDAAPPAATPGPDRDPTPAAPPIREPRANKRRSAAATATEKAPAPPAAPATPRAARLRISSDVPGAQVFLNRQFIGSTPATADDLPPGAYQLNVSTPGYDSHVETLELTPGDREVRVSFRELRLNQSLAVVHKHRFGSCQGTLVATAAGVQYRTTHQEDAFDAPLLALDAFQIDYLNKNLRIQPRQGKRYDFTDPDGNADRLLVFHQQVERAREQLRKGDTP